MSHTDPPIAEKLYDAAYNGDVDEVARLLDGGSTIPPGAVNSALEAAAYSGWADAVTFLLQRGADPNTINPSNHDRQGRTRRVAADLGELASAG